MEQLIFHVLLPLALEQIHVRAFLRNAIEVSIIFLKGIGFKGG
jgi:hypothetical protein